MVKHSLICIALSTALILTPHGAARAQSTATPNQVDPRQLYKQALDLLTAGKFADAAALLEQVTQLMPDGIGAHETLGHCYEQLSRFRDAWKQYARAESLANAAQKTARVATIAAKLQALRPHVSTVRIVLSNEIVALDGLNILLDGEPTTESIWNVDIAIDPGKHVVEARAKGRITWTQDVELKDIGVHADVPVPVMLLEPRIEEPPPEVVPMYLNGMEPRFVPVRSWQRPLGWTSLGLGVASLATGGILTRFAVDRRNASNAGGYCNENDKCDATGQLLRNEALNLGNGATATAIAGGVLTIAGAILVLAPKYKEQSLPRKTSSLRLSVEVAPTGLSVSGLW